MSRILQQIKSTSNIDDMIRYIPLSDFIEPNSYIKRDLTNPLNHTKSNPILLVPLTIGRYEKFVVIDGNHRLTKWKMEEKKDIPCYILDGQALIDNNV